MTAAPMAPATAQGRRQGIILFAHGARDARWAEPFERLRDRVSARVNACVDAQVASPMRDTRVALAFLELMEPGLDRAADALIADGCMTLAIIPIFFGQGSHLRRDLPLLVEKLRERLPTIEIGVAAAAGEDDDVLDAIADYCVRAAISA